MKSLSINRSNQIRSGASGAKPTHEDGFRNGGASLSHLQRIVVFIFGLIVIAVDAGAQPAATNLDFNFYTTTEITNVNQIRLLATQIPTANYSFHLDGKFWWANPAEGRFVLKDNSGAEELEMDLQNQPLAAGQRVRLEGNGTLIKTGTGFKLGG